MLKIFKTVILLPIFALLVDFAVSNREYITLNLWPLSYKVETPVYLLLILIFIIATLICAIISLFSSFELKKKLKITAKELAAEKEENALLKERIDNLKQKNAL